MKTLIMILCLVPQFVFAQSGDCDLTTSACGRPEGELQRVVEERVISSVDKLKEVYKFADKNLTDEKRKNSVKEAINKCNQQLNATLMRNDSILIDKATKKK